MHSTSAIEFVRAYDRAIFCRSGTESPNLSVQCGSMSIYGRIAKRVSNNTSSPDLQWNNLPNLTTGIMY
ncbi:hypothetical protein Mapa_015892 [Marchantia paleacea]|nr:hypothetical protein Mapa_015892 [Marchantia paleacea]